MWQRLNLRTVFVCGIIIIQLIQCCKTSTTTILGYDNMANITQRGIDFIKSHEGLRLSAYYDSVGVLTIGYGSARTFRGRPIFEGMTITQEEAEQALIEDISRHQEFLTFFRRGFNSNQVAALTSFEFNLGSNIWVRDNWDPYATDEQIVSDMNLYHRPPEIIGRRNDEVALFQDTTQLEGDIPPLPPYPEVDDGGVDKQDSFLKKQYEYILNRFVTAMQDLLTYDIYNMSENEVIANNMVSVTKTFNNTYKVQILDGLVKDSEDKLIVEVEPKPPVVNPPYVPPETPNNEVLQKIYDWCKERLGQAFDFDKHWGAQCVDLILQINFELGLGLNVGGWGNAQNIFWDAPVPSPWIRVEGVPSDDAQSKVIYESLQNGSIVFFQYGEYGHVGVKSGDWCMMFNQNVDGTPSIGGPIRETQQEPWVRIYGAGFLGAWTLP